MSQCQVYLNCTTTTQNYNMFYFIYYTYSCTHSYTLTPVRSQSRMVLKAPTANISPLGAHDNEAIGES